MIDPMSGAPAVRPPAVAGIDTYTARTQMSPQTFGLAAWLRYYPAAVDGLAPSAVPPFPWNVATLEQPCPFFPGHSVGETHFAFLSLPVWRHQPLSLLEWARLLPSTFHWRSLTWYGQCRAEAWAARDHCSLRWYLMPIARIKQSEGRTFHQQWDDLPPDYEVPSMIELVTKMILYRRLTGSHPAIEPRFQWARDPYSRSPATRMAISLEGNGRLKLQAIADGCYGAIVVGISRKLPALLTELESPAS